MRKSVDLVPSQLEAVQDMLWEAAKYAIVCENFAVSCLES